MESASDDATTDSNNNMLDSTAFSMAFAKMPRHQVQDGADASATALRTLLVNSYSTFSLNSTSTNKNKRKRNENSDNIDDDDGNDVDDMVTAAITGKGRQSSNKRHKPWQGSDDDNDEESDQASDPDDSFVKRVKQRKAAAETKKIQRWKQDADRQARQTSQVSQSINDVTYSAAAIWRVVQGRELTPDEEIIAPLIDNERSKFQELRRRNKTKYGINSNKASLAKFKDVCFAAESLCDTKKKTKPVKRKIIIQPDSSDDDDDEKEAKEEKDTVGSDKVEYSAHGKDEKTHEKKTSSSAALDMEPEEQVEAIQAESENEEKDDDDNNDENEPLSVKERLANAWSNNLVPDVDAHGFCWIMDNHEHKTIPFFKPRESNTITSYQDEEWVHVMEINPADDLAVIHGQLVSAWERKSDPDLYAGVKGKDKRYKSQTMRLPGLPIPRSQISILQEAKNPFDMTRQDRILDFGTSRSCQCNKTTRDGMNWRRSDGVLDTVLMIYKEAYAICKLGSYFYETYLSGKTSHQEETMLFQSAARRTMGGSPKDCITRNAVFGMCRGVGTGIGEQIAHAISMEYATPKDLIHAFDACSNDDDREILLAQIKLKNGKRSVAGVASTKIFEGVYGREETKASKSKNKSKTEGKSKGTKSQSKRSEFYKTSQKHGPGTLSEWIKPNKQRQGQKQEQNHKGQKTDKDVKGKNPKEKKSRKSSAKANKLAKLDKSNKSNKKRKPKRIVISDSEDEGVSDAILETSSSDSE